MTGGRNDEQLLLEIDCRRWAQKFGGVYIVCGPVLYNQEHETIGVNKVVVPEADTLLT